MIAYLFGAVSGVKNWRPVPLLKKLKHTVDGKHRLTDEYDRFTNTKGKQEISCPQQTDKTVVALVFGQSNSANYDGQRVEQNSPHIINYFDDKCYIASDPLLGATGQAGSVWTLLGEKLLATGRYDNIILVPAGIGGTEIERWEQGGDLNGMLGTVIKKATQRYRFTQMIWHQGESDLTLNTTTNRYKKRFQSMLKSIRHEGVTAPIYVSVASICGDLQTDPDNPVTRAQRELGTSGNGILPGPDTDTLNAFEDRVDDCHMSYVGMQKFSDLLMKAVFQAH